MPIPKNVTFVTFDVYGTLIDWETGIYEAFAKEAERDGFEIDRAVLLPLFHEISREIEGGSYELYAEVLRRTAIEVAKRIELAAGALALGLPARLGAALDALQGDQHRSCRSSPRSTSSACCPTSTTSCSGQTRRHIPTDFDLVVTAQQVRSYKPDPAHFTECARRMGGKRGWVHVAASHYHDVAPCVKAARAGDLGQPQQRDARLLPEQAHRGGSQPHEAAKLLGVSCSRSGARCGSSRCIPTCIVATSAIWQTNCVIVRSGCARGEGGRRGGVWRPASLAGGQASETFVIDSPVLPGRARRPAGADRAGRVSRPRAGCSPRTATGTTCSGGSRSRVSRWAAPRAPLQRMQASPGEAQRELRELRRGALIERPRPLALGAVQALPVPGRCGIGERELRAAPRRRPHRGRDGGADSVGAVLVCRRLPLAGRAAAARPPAARPRPMLATLARSAPARRNAPSRSCPATGGVLRFRARLPRSLEEDPGPSCRTSVRLRRYSAETIVAIGAPAWIGAPSLIGSSAIVPALCAVISFSIFIASMMHSS